MVSILGPGTRPRIAVEDCCHLNGLLWAKIRVSGLTVRNPTTLVPVPTSHVLGIPAALVVRVQPSCVQQLRAVIQRAYHIHPLPLHPDVIDLTDDGDTIDLTHDDENEIIDLT